MAQFLPDKREVVSSVPCIRKKKRKKQIRSTPTGSLPWSTRTQWTGLFHCAQSVAPLSLRPLLTVRTLLVSLISAPFSASNQSPRPGHLPSGSCLEHSLPSISPRLPLLCTWAPGPGPSPVPCTVPALLTHSISQSHLRLLPWPHCPSRRTAGPALMTSVI